MAQNNENDVILNIEINYEAAIKAIAEYNLKIEENKKIQESLKKVLENGSISQEEYAKSMAATKAQMDYNKKAVQELSKEVQNNLKIDREKAGSLNQLKASLSEATAKYNALGAAQRENSDEGKKLKKDISEITAKLKEEEEALGNHRRSVGDYEKATRSLKGELAEYVKQLQQMTLEGKRGSEEFNIIQQKAVELKVAINSTNISLGNMAKSTQEIEGLNQGIQTLIGTFGLYQSVLGLTQEEGKKLDRIMKNLQIVMSAISSLTAIQTALLKESSMMMLAHSIAAKAGALAQAILGASVTTTSIAFKLLRTAIIATGFGALVVLIGTLIAYWDDLVGWLKKSTDGMSGFGKAINKIKEIAMGVWEVIKNLHRCISL